jgi:arylsulfatase A-like enzyme
MDDSAYAKLLSQRLPGYVDPEKVRRWTANYFGLISEVDEWMGVLLDKLDELGIAENTLLAFSADHGEMLGGHGMRENNSFYEESSHVPLLLRMPGTIPAGTVIDDPVSHLDLHSTFLDYVLSKTDYDTDGSSLRRQIEGTATEDPFVVTMWNWTDITDGYKPSRDPSFMIRKGEWKLILSCLAGRHCSGQA